MSPRPVLLHPKRKRKFFEDLAQLLDNDPPDIHPLQGAFYGPDLPVNAATILSPSQESSSATQTLSVPSHSLIGDSFESVEFGATRNSTSAINNLEASQQSSPHYESMVDSILFLPNVNNNDSNSQQQKDQHVRFEFQLEADHYGNCIERDGKCSPLLVTTLSNSGVIAGKPQVGVRLELDDYYDTDRMCDVSPCWLRNGETSCAMHQGFIRRPILLFSLQALDEYIAHCEWLGQQRWRVKACKIARRVFTAMWEADVLESAPPGQDIVLFDYISGKSAEVGVTLDVWRIIFRYWDKYKHNYLHQQELYFDKAIESEPAHIESKWDQVRALLNIYGMKPSQASRLVEQQGGNQLSVKEIMDKVICTATHDLASVERLRVGAELLSANSSESSSAIVRRPTIGQQDGKTAFNAILVYLKSWNDQVQVFPCGSFSRGAAFISVLDILVAVPTLQEHSTTSHADVDSQWFEEVVAALFAANVVKKGALRRLSKSRGACILSFKTSSILLDIKVYCPPKSWFALLYFTGPEDFVLSFFANLIKRSLREISDTSFDCIYASAAEVLGQKALLEIASEKDLFDASDQKYLQPTDRL